MKALRTLLNLMIILTFIYQAGGIQDSSGEEVGESLSPYPTEKDLH